MRNRWTALRKIAIIGGLIAITSPGVSLAMAPRALQTDALPPDLVELQDTGATIEWQVDGALVATHSPDPILLLDRIFVGAGARFAVETFAPALLFVEHGPVRLGSATGGMERYESGQVLARNDFRQLVVENLAQDCASVLRLVVAAGQATGMSPTVAAPLLPSCETEVEPLWGSPFGAIGTAGMPGPAGLAYIARVSWPANRFLDNVLALDGPMAILVEDGNLQATSIDSGQTESIQDDARLFLMSTRWRFANPGPGPVHALVFGVAPVDPSTPPPLPPGRYTSPTYGYSLAWDGDWYAYQDGTEGGHDYFGLGGLSTGLLRFNGYRSPGYDPAACLEEIARMLPELEARPVERDDVRRAMGVEPEAFAAYVAGDNYSFFGCRALGETVVGIEWGVLGSALEAALPEVARVLASLSMSQPGQIAAHLPDVLTLDQTGCFQAEADQILDLDTLANRFANPQEVAELLPQWGWRSSAYRAYTCNAPPAGEAGWVDMSVHRFGDQVSAQQALRYFVVDRAAALNLGPGSAPDLGDLALALEGATANGNDFTLYVSSGPTLIRVTGVSPSGTPADTVVAVTEALLAHVNAASSS